MIVAGSKDRAGVITERADLADQADVFLNLEDSVLRPGLQA